MAQLVATHPIQSSLASPVSGSLQSQVETLKPAGFAAKVLARNESKSRGAVSITSVVPIITARRSAALESQVLPVTPEDLQKVLHTNSLAAFNLLVSFFC